MINQNNELFPFWINNNNKIIQTTSNLKIEKNWQSYRIAVVLLLPCPLIKIIYHLATGILGALSSGNGEIALHNLKWMWSSWYQDLRELLGHVVLLVPYCNDAGFTMVASALAYKNYYNENFCKDIKTIKNREFQSVYNEILEVEDIFNQLNDSHNKMIKAIEEGIAQRENTGAVTKGLENYIKSTEMNFNSNKDKWPKDFWEKSELQHTLAQLKKDCSTKLNLTQDNEPNTELKQQLSQLIGNLNMEFTNIYTHNSSMFKALAKDQFSSIENLDKKIHKMFFNNK